MGEATINGANRMGINIYIYNIYTVYDEVSLLESTYLVVNGGSERSGDMLMDIFPTKNEEPRIELRIECPNLMIS